MRGTGARIEWIAADVADPEQVEGIARLAEEKFGDFDAWANLAGVFAMGHLEDTPLEDQHRIFDVLYWGVITGASCTAR